MAAVGSDTAHPILRNDAASEWLGIEVLALADGHATVSMVLRPEMMNGFGFTHGGMVFSLADTAFALACNPVEGDPGTITVASGADVTFLLPTHAGQRLTAVANRRQLQGRSGLYDVQVMVDDDGTHAGADGTLGAGAASTSAASTSAKVVAEFRGRSRTIPDRTARSTSP